jgi:hypothetical protein
MPDDPTPPEITPDVRDERMAELLAVEPLDEVTRRRLVQGALLESARRPSRFANVAAVAAAILIGAGVGAVLVNQPDEPPASTQAQAVAPTEAAAPAGGASSTAAGEQFNANAPAVPVEPLGDLGDVSTRSKLRDAVTSATKRGAAADSTATVSYPCLNTPPDQIGLVAISAAGVGTYQKLTTTVVVGTSPSGEALAIVLAQPPGCEVLVSAVLPRR